MQIPILNGIFADETADFRTSYPRNMVPVLKPQGVSEGYLRPADGVVGFGFGPGRDRGAINWRGDCYRVMGSSLCRVDSAGAVTVLGDIPGGSQVTMDYSFDLLAIAADGALFYCDSTKVTQVTDPDLGFAADVLWVDGYFMTTDGNSLVVTELTDPMAVNPLKYGSAEADPDRIMGLLKIRNEVYAVNRNTIEVFNNVGGSLFPFERVEGAQIQRGAVGTFACAVFMNAVAFIGGGRNEAPAVWLGANGASVKLSTREVDQMLQEYGEDVLSTVVLEPLVDKSHQLLLIHLPDYCLVYDAAASELAKEPVWHTRDSGAASAAKYRARNFVWAYDRWLVGDPTSNAHGYLDPAVSSHYGAAVGWEFGTMMLYNDSRGAIVHGLELVALPGRVLAGADPVIWSSYSLDGETWSIERAIKAGKQGQRNKRLVWLQQGAFRNYRIQKFRGTSDAHLAFARLEASLEALNV